MPTYDYMCSECKNVFTNFSKISDRNIPTESLCPSCGSLTVSQKIGNPLTVTHVGSILSKTSDGWNDVLNKVKGGSGRGSTIHTK